ncbi:hypothetical protein FRC0190_01315 [Corynebacterium rouxii]|uniref:Uncharacterized protein n=2 Tax=Corynebacterium rouxii TaxID=2719119 RepID=A0A6I8MBP4_9CORY|nr:hypothetical protein FRC0190_01315 [Corynebacterium rouxii]
MKHLEWLDRTTAGDSLRQISERSDIPLATLSHQMRKETFKPELIIRISEAYGESPVIALVDLGFMSSRWIKEPGVRTALSRATDEELTDELLRRLRLIEDTPVDDLAELRRNTPTPPPSVRAISDDEAAAAIREAHQLRGAAHPATTELTEPETP